MGKVLRVSVRIRLMPDAREQQCAIKARVEGSPLAVASALHLDPAEIFIPCRPGRGAKLIHAFCSQLAVKVTLGLLEGDKRGCNPRLNRARVSKPHHRNLALALGACLAALPRLGETHH